MSRTLENSPPEAAPDGLRCEFLPPVAYIETDRYCDYCGYNLRTQPVVREPHTQFLVARCPECGRFHSASEHSSAGRLWLRRLATLLLFLWIIVVAHAGAGVLLAQGAWGMLTLEELTHYRRVPLTTNPTAKTQRYSYTREVDPEVPYFGLFMMLILGASGATAGLGGLLAVVIFHHWRRWVCILLALIFPPLVAAVVAAAWRADVPQLFDWSLPYLGAHASVQILGGLLGVVFGRPLARVIVRVVLPPRVRPALSFLWLVDGKPMPAGSPGR